MIPSPVLIPHDQAKVQSMIILPGQDLNDIQRIIFVHSIFIRGWYIKLERKVAKNKMLHYYDYYDSKKYFPF